MSFIKKYLKSISYIFLFIIVFFFFTNILYYFNIISNNMFKIMKIIILLISVFINSLYLGKRSNKNGYLEGIKLGSIFIFVLFILNVIFREDLKIRLFLYYIIIVLTSTFGSMIGINKKEKEPK